LLRSTSFGEKCPATRPQRNSLRAATITHATLLEEPPPPPSSCSSATKLLSPPLTAPAMEESSPVDDVVPCRSRHHHCPLLRRSWSTYTMKFMYMLVTQPSATSTMRSSWFLPLGILDTKETRKSGFGNQFLDHYVFAWMFFVGAYFLMSGVYFFTHL
jgi:hypothetical protein